MAKSKNNKNPRPFTRESLVNHQLKTGSREVEVMPDELQTIHFREMTALESQERMARSVNNKGKVDVGETLKLNVTAFLSQVFDPDTGLKLFTPDDRGDVEKLGSSIVSPVATDILELSGIKPVDNFRQWVDDNLPEVSAQYDEENEPMELVKKNFTATRKEGSPIV